MLISGFADEVYFNLLFVFIIFVAIVYVRNICLHDNLSFSITSQPDLNFDVV